jgi:site-specific recombinase XerD
MAEVTPADGDKFREYLATTARLSPATVGKRLQIARQFFRAAMRARAIPENPFADVKGPESWQCRADAVHHP